MPIFQSSGGKNQPQNTEVTPKSSRTKSVLRYTMMPEIIPRIRALGFHFGHFAYLLAMVFASAKLIDRNHPVMNAANIGQFGVKQVIAIAANNLTWSRNNIDQIAIFAAIVIGLIMIVIQAGLIAVAALVGFDNPANAQGFFSPPTGYVAADDPMMIFFAQVFGDLGGFWGADFKTGDYVFGTQTSIHDGIYAILSFYSKSMMVIAMIIVIYYIMVVVAEAAQTGTPFGKRFNSVWAPIRLCIALGLLVPLGSGLNSAQYLTLFVAKMGSNLGTSAWALMASNMSRPDIEKNVLGGYNNDWIVDAAFNVLFLETCMYASNKEQYSDPHSPEGIKRVLRHETANKGHHKLQISYERGRGFGNGAFRNCGQINIEIKEADSTSLTLGSKSLSVQEAYNVADGIIRDLIGPLDSNETGGKAIPSAGLGLAKENISVGGRISGVSFYYNVVKNAADVVEKVHLASFDANDFKLEIKKYIDDIYNNRTKSFVYAGVWYLEISRITQDSKSVMDGMIPNFNIGEVGLRGYNGKAGDMPTQGGIGKQTTALLTNLISDMADNASEYRATDSIPEECKGIGEDSGFIASVGCLVASWIIPDELTILAYGEKNLNPISVLISAGHGIFQRSFSLVAAGVAAGAIDGALNPDAMGVQTVLMGTIKKLLGPFGILASLIAGIAAIFGPILIVLGSVGLGIGFILFFLVPVMPFIYFFFAILAWVMEIFEAIIAMPLWALAHLRIDGDGLPGQAAGAGYYLLFAILIRPVLLVVSLVGAAVIFGAATYMLQTLFTGLITIKAGGNSSGLENLVYTIIFTYIVYTIGITTFKLVDTVPNQMLRWMSAGVQSFSDGHDVDMGGQQSMIAAAGGFIGGSIAQNMTGASKGFGQSLGGLGHRGGGGKGNKKEAKRHDDETGAYLGEAPDIPEGSEEDILSSRWEKHVK